MGILNSPLKAACSLTVATILVIIMTIEKTEPCISELAKTAIYTLMVNYIAMYFIMKKKKTDTIPQQDKSVLSPNFQVEPIKF
jgi:Na+/alanine symporter